MDKAKKKIASALDGLRNLQSSSAKAELDVKEVLSPSDFCLTKVSCVYVRASIVRLPPRVVAPSDVRRRPSRAGL